jgi:hypothetical protein
MIVVAITALVLGANDLRLRRDRFLDLRYSHEWRCRASLSEASRHASTAADNEREANRLRVAIASSSAPKPPGTDGRLQSALTIEAAAASERAAEQKCRARARFHDELRSNYERAARYPWTLVGPEPPEPE